MISAYLARTAHEIESLFEKLRPKRGDGPLTIEPYIGYSTPNGLVLRGRVLENSGPDFLDRLVGKLGTAGAMAQNFMTDEVRGVEVRSGDEKAVSDEEGYFQLLVPKSRAKAGCVPVMLEGSDETFDLPVAVTPDVAQRGVISDIDDTVIETGAWQLARNLWTTLTTAASDRVVHRDTVKILRKFQAEANPVFYVSSSPWNLHQYLLEVFKTGDVPPGPMFLRDLGVDETKFIKSSHGSHKGGAINTILAANPDLTFTLIGDTGQHDAQVYLDVIREHPGRIEAVYLRRAGDHDSADEAAAEAIRLSHVDFFDLNA